MKILITLIVFISLAKAQNFDGNNFPTETPVEFKISKEVNRLNKIGICFTNKYKRLIFTSQIRGDYAIWYSEFVNNKWTKIKRTAFSKGKFNGRQSD